MLYHDVALVDIFDVTGLHGESIDDDREMGNVTSILFEAFRTLHCISLLIGVDAVFELLNRGPRTSSYGLDADHVVSLLFGESCGHALLPVGFSLQ